MFINDFPQKIKKSLSNMFADDCCIYTTGKNLNETKDIFQDSVKSWNISSSSSDPRNLEIAMQTFQYLLKSLN